MKKKNNELITKTVIQTDNPFITSKIVNNLEHLMTKVTSKEVNPATVNAACQCAEKITDLFKLHLDLEKHNLKREILTKDIKAIEG